MREPHFPDKPIKLDYIFYHIGRMSFFWADCENAVDHCISVFARAFPDPLYQRPISTKRRIAVFRKGLGQLHIPDKDRARGKKLIDEFAELADHRRWTTHGSASDDTWTGQTYKKHRSWVRLGRDNLTTGIREYRDYQLSDLEYFGDVARDLSGDFWDWLTVDLGCATPKKTEKVLRKIGVRNGRRLPRGKSINDLPQ